MQNFVGLCTPERPNPHHEAPGLNNENIPLMAYHIPMRGIFYSSVLQIPFTDTQRRTAYERIYSSG